MLRPTRGFTIVEITVVIAVISLLVSIVVMGYTRVQSSARDSKRETDATSFRESLNKYYDKLGEYPSSCPNANYSTVTKLCSYVSGSLTTPTAGQPINSSTTTAQLDNIGVTNPNALRDPRSVATNPFGQFANATSSNQYYYLYAGPLYNPTAGAITASPFDFRINGKQCVPSFTVPSQGYSAFIFAYFSEADQKIHLVASRENTRPTIPAGYSANCTLNTL